MTAEDPEAGDVIRGERFSGGPARGFLSSLEADRRLFEADLAVDRAHVVMLEEQGIIEPDDAREILRALADVEADGFDALPDGEDVHAAIETAVIERIGPTGGRMHTARSRNDEVATCIRYRLRSDLLGTLRTLTDAREALLADARTHAGTVMPGYTHLQPAQPTTVGHWLCSYESALRRDTARYLDAFDRTNRSPLGAAAFAGTPFDIDRDRTASLLGFEAVLTNAADAVSARDFLVETAAAGAALAGTLSGLAADGLLLANRGLLTLDDDYASTSSIMPQKKNPDTLELVRATAGDAHAALSGLCTTLKGLPRAYNRDLQKATPHVWRTVDAVTAAVEVAAGAITTATWETQELETAAGEGFSVATGIADQLALAGIPFRTAHELVAEAAASGGDLEALDAAARDVLGEPLGDVVDPAAIESVLDPAQNVEARDSAGGPAPAALRDAIGEADRRLRRHVEAIDDRERSIGKAADSLSTEVSARV